MNIRNIEFKAKVDDIEKYENKLLTLNPVLIGTDHQVDTYFNVSKGRLKLREGNIENALIYYNREDVQGSKMSEVILYQHTPEPALKEILGLQLGVKTVVDKRRKIYFIDNVKFHFDNLSTLGTFIEVEAIDSNNEYSNDDLKKQCDQYFNFFELDNAALVDKSYSDLLETG